MEAGKAKLYVGGIPKETSEAALRDHFRKYGDVSHAVVPKNRETGIPRGFAFVWFSDPASGKAALVDEHAILGKKVLVREGNRTEHHPNQNQNQEVRLEQNHCCRTCGNSLNGNNTNTRFRSRKIFVGGLPTSLTEDEFKTFFERFGETTDVVIMHDPYRRPRGFGFVTFASEESAEDVMKNNFYEIHGKFVEVKRAIPKELRNFCYDSCEVNGHAGRGRDYCYYWPVYCPAYASPYGSFHGYGHLSSYHKFGWGAYGAGAYSVSRAVHFNGSGPAYMDNMFGYYGMPIPIYNGFMPNGFDTMTSQAGCVENESNAPALPQIEELKLTDCIDGEAEAPALPGIEELKLRDDGSESDGRSSDATNQDDDH